MDKVEIKNKYFFKNKIQMIIYIILFAILLYLFVVLGNLEYQKDVLDSERFSQEFNLVPQKNVFEYVNSQEAYMLTTGKDAIILFGFSKNEWVNYYAKIVNEVAIETGIEKIAYYDFLDDRIQNNGTYEAIVEHLKDYLTFNDLGETNLNAPTLVIIKNYEVTYFNSDTSYIKGNINPKTYWSAFQQTVTKSELEVAFNEYLERG